MTPTRSELQKTAQSAVLQKAFLRWESAVVLGGTIVLTVLLSQPFPGWPVWGWPVLGLLGLVALVYASLIGDKASGREFLDLFRQEFDPFRIRDDALRREVEDALEYQQHIEVWMREQRSGVLRDWLESMAGQFYGWIGNIYELAQKLDAYRQGELLAHEQQVVVQRIEELAARRRLEHDPVIRRELDAALEVKGQQWQALRGLDARILQNESSLRESITELAAVYAQVQQVDAQDVQSGRSSRLEADIREQVDRLKDLVGTIYDTVETMSVGDPGI